MKKNTETTPSTFQIPNNNKSFDINYWIAVAIIVILPFLYIYPLAFSGKTFIASDTKNALGMSHQLVESWKTSDEPALWAENDFAGMPSYMIAMPHSIWGLDTVVKKLTGFFLDWRVLYFILMGLGVFYFLRQFKIEPYLAAFAATAFQLSTYFIVIIKVGHDTKFMAIAFIPWFLLALNYTLTHLKWQGAIFLAVIFSLELRSSHPQITFYMLIAGGILAAFWIYEKVKEKDYRSFFIGSSWSLFGLLLGAITIAYPYLLNYEYSKFTIRAGTVASGTAGLSTDYAMAWSFDWLETITLFVPNFFGGHSPYYWWQMPFTEGPQYIGASLLLLASLTFLTKMNRLTISLWIITLITWLMSMGSNFSTLSNFLLDYFPMYNKFRTPSMILVLLSFTLPALSVLGVKNFLDVVSDKKIKNELVKKFYILSAMVLGAGIIFWIYGMGLSFTKPNEISQYDAQTLAMLTKERQSLMNTSMLRFVFFSLTSALLIYLAIGNKISRNLFSFLLLGLLIVDLWSYNSQYVDRDYLENKKTYTNSFLPTKTDNFLLKDKENYRIYPIGGLFQQTRFNYYHQSIGGYHGAKLAIFQDLLDNCLQNGSNPQLPINFNLLTAFGVKYIIFPQLFMAPFQNLTPLFNDDQTKQTVVDYGGYHGKYFFVSDVQVVEKPSDILLKMNLPDWKPNQTVFIEKVLDQPIGYDSLATVKEVNFSFSKIELETTSQKPSFLYLSEIYYPKGWTATIDGKETAIYKTNYAFRGMVVPEGKHNVVMEFKPTIYTTSLYVSGIAGVAMYGLLGFIIFTCIRTKKNSE